MQPFFKAMSSAHRRQIEELYMLGTTTDRQDFWLLDLGTMGSRRLTRLNSSAAMRTFDITPDGRRIVFDRARENSDILLIDLATKQARP